MWMNYIKPMRIESQSGDGRAVRNLMRTPTKRFWQSEKLVGLAVPLASDAVSFLTGRCIAVQGGYLASGVNS